MKWIFFLNLCFFWVQSYAIFEYDSAAKAYKNNDFETAQKKYNSILINNSDDYSSLYNLGKIAYKQNKFDVSHAYFTQALKQQLPEKLKEQTLFDLGNAQVKLAQWNDALQSYEEILKINGSHEYAKKMIEQIKKFLEEQKNENEKQENNEQENNDKENNDNQQEKNNNENSNEEKNDQNNKSQQDQNQERDRNNNDQQQQQSQPNLNQNDKNNSQQNESSKENEQVNNKQDDENRKNDMIHNNSQQSNQNQKETQSKHQKQQSVGSSENAMRQISNDLNDKENNYEMLLLQEIENEDAAMAKMILQQQLHNEAKRHGQKNW